jgi:flagellar protein FlgJ
LAISPPSDIVLDVARAADPARYRAAVERLTQMSGLASGALDAAGAAYEGISDALAPVLQGLPDFRGKLSGLPEASTPAVPESYRKFEAFVLQSFVQTMLPENATHVFGEGNAGAVWKSFLAEQIANEIAAAGGVGIAEQIAAVHPGPDAEETDRPIVPAARGSSANTVVPGEVTGYAASLVLDFADALRGTDRDDGSRFAARDA